MTTPERPGSAVDAQALSEFGSQAVASLRLGFARSRLPMLIADDYRRWVTANPAALELLGLAPDEVVWRTMDEVTPPGGRARLREQWGAFLVSGAAEGWYELYIPDRGTVPVEFSALANVLPGRHLSVLVTPEETADVPATGPGSHAAWAPVANRVADRPTLTKREREVMTLVAAGGHSGDMAKHLFLSPETVKSHVQNSMAKLGAHTRAHAVAIALVTEQIIWSISDSPGGESSAHMPAAH